MDKVIIAGIDVSGCPFYQYQTKEDYEMRYPESGDCEIGLAGYLFGYSRITEELEKACIDNPNCYYKQLKRKEQECEKLKWLLETKCQSEWEKENAELKAENEKLKTNIGIYKGIIDADKEENERLKARLRPLEDSYFKGLSVIQIAELAKKSIRITAENRKLEYALQEIREYCEEQNLKADYTACEIIDKINEVIGANQ